MKVDSVIVFLGRAYELCKAFGLFGKENLIYQDVFDHSTYMSNDIAKYYFPELDCELLFLSRSNLIPSMDLSQYKNILICVSEDDVMREKCDFYRRKFPNCKLAFLWMYGEVFSMRMYEKCKIANLDFILTGSNQHNTHDPNTPTDINTIATFDYKLNFKYFFYYIGYYYLTGLFQNLKQKVYDKNQLPIFTYSKASHGSSWRNLILNRLHEKFPNKIQNGSSINDSYDLEFTKYKHFETINDYSYRNYNIVFETLDVVNNFEWFATEKTFKALFFGNPFYLIASSNLVNELSKDFYLLNSEFETVDDFVGCDNLEERFEEFQKKSEVNHYKLLEYIKDYKHTEYFKKLLYGTT